MYEPEVCTIDSQDKNWCSLHLNEKYFQNYHVTIIMKGVLNNAVWFAWVTRFLRYLYIKKSKHSKLHILNLPGF